MGLDKPTVRPIETRGRPGPVDAPQERPRHLAAAEDGRREHLDALRKAILTGTPFTARIVAPAGTGSPYLRVVNLEMARLAEDIGCRIAADGGHWFTWSWGEAIGPATDLHGTVQAITRVLTCGT